MVFDLSKNAVQVLAQREDGRWFRWLFLDGNFGDALAAVAGGFGGKKCGVHLSLDRILEQLAVLDRCLVDWRLEQRHFGDRYFGLQTAG